MTSRSAVFLDRDGVLNDSVVVDGLPHPPRTLDELRISRGAVEACRRLRQAGLLLVGASNQPDVARGTVTRETVDAINDEVKRRVGLDALLVCPHDDADKCDCRKPLPGLLLRAARMLDIDLSRSVMVGDRWRDVEAGRRAGCATIFVDNDYSEPKPEGSDVVVTGLAQAVPYILSMTGSGASLHERAATVDLTALRIEIFADGADRDAIVELAANPLIKGFTTNPTLMRAAGVKDYEQFARDVTSAVPDMPISFEVFADDCQEMERQALRIATWGENVYAKIPVTDTKGAPTTPVIRTLTDAGVKLNITALFTPEQVRWVSETLGDGPPSFISVFAGRIADSGRDPLPLMRECLEIMAPHPNQRLIWASPREILNVIQADQIGCHVITVTHDLLKKLPSLGKGLDEFSLDTVRMFHDDAVSSGFSL
ncbi:MAG TPA: transaldolase [Candidatus Dormibacteraeota bacterium]